MDELGNILREARETKGLTLAEAQDEIRINSRFLKAMENGNFDALPTPVHVRGFLRNYARFLDLDPDPLLARYEANQQQRPVPVPTTGAQVDITPDNPLPPRTDQPFFDPVNVDLEASGGSGSTESTLRLVIIIALIVAIGLIASRFVPMLLGQGDGRDTLAETVQQIMAGAGDETAEATTPAGDNAASDGENVDQPTPNATTQAIISTGRNNPDAATAAAPTPTRPSLPAVMETIQLRIDISERTWLQVTVDGEVVLEGQARRGDGPYDWEAAEDVRILTGNAAGVFVTINGTELGRLGGRGDVVDETWETTGN